MPAARNGAAWLIGLLLAMFVGAAWVVMIAPLESGDVYPPYSTLRADPLGAKALFESLTDQPSLTVSRLFKARPALDSQSVLFIMGVNPVGWSAAPKLVLDSYEGLLKNGGRIVIAFLATRGPEMPPMTDALQAQWNLRPRYRQGTETTERDEGIIPRQTALYFEIGPEWRTIQERDGEAEVIERNLAGGTMVLVADSFALSNQGLVEKRDADLIAGLVGPAKSVIFDENQFGVSESGSVAVLIRKYRLEGAIAVLLVIAALFVWRSTSSFLPPRDLKRSAPVAGRDSLDGLAALLRRNIPEDQLLAVCLKQWRRSGPRRRPQSFPEESIQHSGRDLVADYRNACRTLMEKK